MHCEREGLLSSCWNRLRCDFLFPAEPFIKLSRERACSLDARQRLCPDRSLFLWSQLPLIIPCNSCAELHKSWGCNIMVSSAHTAEERTARAMPRMNIAEQSVMVTESETATVFKSTLQPLPICLLLTVHKQFFLCGCQTEKKKAFWKMYLMWKDKVKYCTGVYLCTLTGSWGICGRGNKKSVLFYRPVCPPPPPLYVTIDAVS